MEKTIFPAMALLVSICFGVFFCGPQQKGETVVKIPNPNQPISATCGGVPVGNTEQTICETGQIGAITKECVSKGNYAEWIVKGSTCKPVDQCQAGAENKTTFVTSVKPIIEDKCIRCHGTIRMNEYDAAKGLIDEMIRRINLDDLNTQRMPPSPGEPLPFGTRETFKKWKDDGLINDSECVPPDTQGSLKFNTLPKLEESMLAALNVLDGRGQKNMRVITADHKANLGSSKDEMGIYVGGINKAVNALNAKSGDVIPCIPIDDIQGACRIDLENIGLTRAEWDLIVKNADLVLKSNTNIGKLIQQLTGAEIPWLTADQFIQASHGKGSVYAQIMGIPDNQADYFKLKGFDIAQEFQTFRARLGGGFGSPISLQKNRLLSFVKSDDGTCAITFDPVNLDGNDKRNLFKNPLLFTGTALFEFAASEVICTLPNGEMEMSLWNAAGVRQNAAPTNIVADIENPFGDFEIASSKDCYRCHANGYIPFQDQVRSAITRSPNQLSKQDIDLVKELYGSQGELDAKFISYNDNYKEYKGSIKVFSKDDPINYWGDRFLKDWTINDVCAFIRLPLQDCREEIGQSAVLSAQVGSLLTGGTISFNQFKDTFPIFITELRLGEEPL